MSQETHVIVGAGIAGISAAESLRSEGFDGRIVVFGKESEPPYERPPLSKQRLRDEIPRDAVLLRAAGFYELNAIELQLDNALVRIDPAQRRVQTERDRSIRYDKLLLATGAAPSRLTIPGHELEHIHYLRTMDDCEQLRKQLEHRPRVLIVGTGFIGCEVAASARQVGCSVVLVGPEVPLQRALGREIGEIYAECHRSHEVVVKTGETVVEFRGVGHVEEAVLSDQSTVPCDLVVVGIGVSPALEAIPGDMKLSNGIVTDEYCRTSIENIFAAGDVASAWRPRLQRRVRFEHYENAQLQGAAAGRAMAGKMQAYDPIPFFWSDQFELGLQYYGYAVKWDDVILRGKPAEHSFTAFYLRDGRIEAICNVNRSRESSREKQLLGVKGISTISLADETVDLTHLASPGASATTEA